MEVISRFVNPSQGGIVEIVRTDHATFDAYWIPSDFKGKYHVGAGSAERRTYDETLKYVNTAWDDRIRPLESYGDFILYLEAGIVGASKFNEHAKPVPARDIPDQAQLLPSAAGFFRYWLGHAAVSDSCRLNRPKSV